MADETKFVTAYDKKTGRKLEHYVPEHYVTEMAGITGLSATPRGKAATAADEKPAESGTKQKETTNG